MLLDSEHLAWLRDHWTGGTAQRDRLALAGGLKRAFNISRLEAQETVKVFLSKSEQEEDVVTILQQENAKRRHRQKVSRIVLVGFVSSYVVLLLLMKVFHGDLNDISGMSGLFGVVGASVGLTGRHKMAARAAAKLKDKRALGSLIEILGTSEDKGLRSLAEDAVAEMLPLLEEDDYADLDQTQKEQLAKALFRAKKLNFAVAILGVFRRFADIDMIPYIESFTAGKTALNKKDFDRASSLAHMTLADIRMRGAKKQIDARVQEIGGTLPEVASRILGSRPK